MSWTAETVKEVLMRRDAMSAEDADVLIQEAKDDLNERLALGEMPFDICEEWFGLEPDYIEDLIGTRGGKIRIED